MTPVPSLAQRLRDRIATEGPLAVSDFVDAALYDRDEGFYASGGKAGRRGDFITSVEVGPLFGAVISNAVDSWWKDAGHPKRFVVADLGAGPGTLARTVTQAAGECLRSGALEWVMVERSSAQRGEHPSGAHLSSAASIDELAHVDAAFGNEVLDNIAFDIVARRAEGWVQRLVDVVEGDLMLVDGDATAAPVGSVLVAVGTELPVVTRAVDWIGQLRSRWPAAQLTLIDYAATTLELAARDGEWLRSYRDHERVSDWLAEPGSADITIDLPLEQLAACGPDAVIAQHEFLSRHGIEALVAEGREIWAANAHRPDVAALRARSRISETEALQNRNGLGRFRVLQWRGERASE